jgi:hypothetical protein
MWTGLISVCVGIVIGWNVPQPAWAKSAQDKVVALFKGAADKSDRPGTDEAGGKDKGGD